MVWSNGMVYGMVIGLMVGRGRHPLTLPSPPSLPLTKEFLLLQFLIWPAVLSKTPRVEEWLLTLSAHGFFQSPTEILLPLWGQEFAAPNARGAGAPPT